MAVKLLDCALRTLLVLSMWHAPVPWLHAHDLAGPIVEQSGSLARHIDEFHAGEAAHGREAGHGQTGRGEQTGCGEMGHLDTEIGWHTHLVLPWCLTHRSPCPVDRPAGDDEGHFASGLKFGMVLPAPIPVSVGYAVTGAYVPVAELCALAHPLQGLAVPVPADARNAALQFMGTYGCSVSLGDLLSVRVC